MVNAKAKILKILAPISTKIPNIKSLTIVRKNKVRPLSTAAKQNEILLLRENSLSFDRRHDEYLQARREVLRSYHLMNGGGDSLKQKMKSSFEGMCRDVAAAVRTRVGVRVYRLTVVCPWSGGGKVIVFRCLLPRLN